ncbi:hypothetical protein GE061_017942 [Apolygus lucorum]|uniref:DUF4468 domain-containing protein n=1 Tax=Apolygus lucorum TaxID=248454 RepID=A0A8S9XF45_APOLU|nr:hypothetical protein GE061_017942 [Apolygus lucorum]
MYSDKMMFGKALLICVFVAVSFSVPVRTASPNPQQIRELKEAGLQWFQSTLPASNSEQLEDVNQHQIIPNADTNYILLGRDGIEYGVSQILFDRYEFNASTSSSKFHFTYPNLTKVYNYEAAGVIFGYNVSGKGVFKQEVIGNGFHVTDLRFEEVNNSLQISTLELTIVLDKYVFDFGGLNVNGTSAQQLEEVMAEVDKATFDELQLQESQLYAESYKTSLNKFMSGRTIEEVIQWLKEHSKNNNSRPDFI